MRWTWKQPPTSQQEQQLINCSQLLASVQPNHNKDRWIWLVHNAYKNNLQISYKITTVQFTHSLINL